MAPDGERSAWTGSDAGNAAMDRYANGDASAFPALYDAIAPRLEAYVRRRTRDASRIDDVVQQTFERIHRARGTFLRGSDVLSWAFTIARNLCVDLGAQGWREHGVAGDGAADPLATAVAQVVDAERVATARETLARVASAFRRLPERQQLALELVRVEGFSLAAAAENLGVTLPSLKMSVFRGTAALRDLARDDDRGDEPAAEKEPLRGLT